MLPLKGRWMQPSPPKIPLKASAHRLGMQHSGGRLWHQLFWDSQAVPPHSPANGKSTEQGRACQSSNLCLQHGALGLQSPFGDRDHSKGAGAQERQTPPHLNSRYCLRSPQGHISYLSQHDPGTSHQTKLPPIDGAAEGDAAPSCSLPRSSIPGHFNAPGRARIPTLGALRSATQGFHTE